MPPHRQLSFLKPEFSPERLRSGLHQVWHDPLGSWALRLATLCLFALVALAGLVSQRVPPEIPLHFSRPWGVNQLVGRQSLWYLAIGGTAIALLHTLAAAAFFNTYKLLSRLVAWTGAFLLILLILVTVTVYLRVGSW